LEPCFYFWLCTAIFFVVKIFLGITRAKQVAFQKN